MRGVAALLSLGLLVAVSVACADDAPDLSAAVTQPPTARPATELAPSQVAASTVPDPGAPPPCDVAAVDFSAVPPGAGDTVITIRNGSSVTCEVDVSRSRDADPLMEPSVWLGPGAEAELLATDVGGCEQPTDVTGVELVVNGTKVSVPVVLPASCGVTLTAIYPVEPG